MLIGNSGYKFLPLNWKSDSSSGIWQHNEDDKRLVMAGSCIQQQWSLSGFC